MAVKDLVYCARPEQRDRGPWEVQPVTRPGRRVSSGTNAPVLGYVVVHRNGLGGRFGTWSCEEHARHFARRLNERALP